MNQSEDPTARHEAPPEDNTGPRVSRSQMLDVDRLRRSNDDRYIAGVCGGLARHFDIDVAIVRVLFVVLTITGGASILLYGALWLFVPDDRGTSPIHTGADTRRVLLIAAVALTAVMLFSTGFSADNWHFGWFFGLIALGILAFVLRRGKHGQDAPPNSGFDPTGDGPGAAATPTWAPPNYSYTLPPSRPRRTGVVLFWPTLALIAIGLGALGMYDAHHHVADGAYAALAIAITGTMLLIGSFVGRPGGLIALGLLIVPILLGSSLVGNGPHGQGRSIDAAPSVAAAVQDSYRIGTGRINLDLSHVTDPQNLLGRTLTLHVNAGEVLVTLPRGLAYRADASLGVAGDIQIAGEEANGLHPNLNTSSAASGAPALAISVTGKVGHIDIEEIK